MYIPNELLLNKSKLSCDSNPLGRQHILKNSGKSNNFPSPAIHVWKKAPVIVINKGQVVPNHKSMARDSP